MSTLLRRGLRLTSVRIGVALLLTTLLLFAVLFNKDRIDSALMAGEHVEVTFDRAYKLRPHVSQVKVGYVVVGKVVGVERDDDGNAAVELKVEEDVLERLGSAPSATIRPTTLLGGSYFVDLQPGGDPGAFTAASIPVERTATPVELDVVARTLQPDTRAALQGTTGNLDAALDAPGREALDRFLAEAPDTLAGAAPVLEAARGEQPERDLAAVVSGLEQTARVLTENDGQLDAIVTDLAATSQVLGARGDDLATALEGLSPTLTATRSTLGSLDTTLTTLRDMAAETRPVARSLTSTLEALDPTVEAARPLVADARTLVVDATPLLGDLTPSATDLDGVLTDLEGAVLERVDGTLVPWLYDAYQGQGPYAATYSEKTMYEEIVYTFVNLTRASGLLDSNGHAVSFQPGVGTGSVGGLPISIEQMFTSLTTALYFDEPADTLPPLDRSGASESDLPALLSTLLGGQ